MVAPKKIDPLIEQLPPNAPLQPLSAQDVEFTVEITPYIFLGQTYWRWEVIEHGFKGYAGDHTGQREGQFPTSDLAERAAREHVARIREVIQQKLDAPNSYRITL